MASSFQSTQTNHLLAAAIGDTKVTWASGSKTGLGTSFFDGSSGESLSNVWYTLAHGVLTEVYYPDVATPNLRSLEFYIADHNGSVDREQGDMVPWTRLVYTDALVYEQTSTAKTGRYKLRKTYITHPSQHALMMQVTFTAICGQLQDYDIYLKLGPGIRNSAIDDSAEMVQQDGMTYLVAYDTTAALALTSSIPLVRRPESLADPLVEGSLLESGSLLAKLDLMAVQDSSAHAACTDGACTFVVTIGFGATKEGAMHAASCALNDDFVAVLQEYRTGWQTYVKTLHPPCVGDAGQYYAAAMVLKAHEDKLRPGAIVASLSIPWGTGICANDAGVGGYHLVWPRDLYHIATALQSVGDDATARRALAYLADVLQKSDGSFPQNTWLDGTSYWPGLQLDEVALPILLAYQLNDWYRYASFIKPAADFLVANGPWTPQERWEENAGFSPSTLAAEIAGLVVAGEMAGRAGDYAAAARYIRVADAWAQAVNKWTAVTNGSLTDSSYYIRISDTEQPNDGHFLELKNGGGWHVKDGIVDAGFLELVRLGVKAADDPLVTRSLNVIDDLLHYETSYGPTWRRYPHDGYGEHADGAEYDGIGIGRPWPLLTGERGEYEIAWQMSEKRTRPKHLYGPVQLLKTLADSANAGHMIPEQIWDDDSLPNRYLYRDCGSGSATPLAWGMAQYLRLVACIQHGQVVEVPRVVWDRYVGQHQVLVDVNCEGTPETAQPFYDYPRHPVFHSGDFELKRVQIYRQGDKVHFVIGLGHLDNPWAGPSGISKQMIDIYIDMDAVPDSGQRCLKDLSVQFTATAGWERWIRITGNWRRDAHVYNSDFAVVGEIEIYPDYQANTIHVVASVDQFGSTPGPGWGVMVILTGEQYGGVRPVRRIADEWSFGCRMVGDQAVQCTHQLGAQIIDLLVPDGGSKEAILRQVVHGQGELPMVRM